MLREGDDVTLVSTGYMTHFALQAADELAARRRLRSTCCTIRPSSRSMPDAGRVGAEDRAVVTVENQNIIGGLGGAVCEVLSEQCPTPVKRLGIPDRFGEVATEDYLFDKHGFGVISHRRGRPAH